MVPDALEKENLNIVSGPKKTILILKQRYNVFCVVLNPQCLGTRSQVKKYRSSFVRKFKVPH